MYIIRCVCMKIFVRECKCGLKWKFTLGGVVHTIFLTPLVCALEFLTLDLTQPPPGEDV